EPFVHRHPAFDADEAVACRSLPEKAERHELVGRSFSVVAEGLQDTQSFLVDVRRIGVVACGLRPPLDGAGLPELLGCHSGSPKRSASSRTSLCRRSAFIGSWIMPSRLSRSVTSGISTHGDPYAPRKKLCSSGGRGRCPPPSGLSAG